MNQQQQEPGLKPQLEKQEQVQVRFFSHSPDIPLEGVLVYVPVSLKRYGLSELIQHLLSLDKPRPFEFLIEGKLLIEDLKGFLNQKGWSYENTLDIEVIHASQPLNQKDKLVHGDWISDVSHFIYQQSTKSDGRYLVTSEFSGALSIWKDRQCLLSKSLSSFPIKSIDVHYNLISGSEKATVFAAHGHNAGIYSIDPSSSSSPNLTTIKILNTHIDTVECISYNANVQFLASGSWDRNIQVLSYNESDNSDETTKKSHVLNGHTGAVQCLQWLPESDKTQLLSGSWDHSIKIWDPNTNFQLSDSLISNAPVFCMDYSSALGLIASGHGDHHLQIWDTKNKKASAMSLKSHTGFVNKVQWSESQLYNLYSISHDGTLKHWDIRTSKPLYSLGIGSESSTSSTNKLFAFHQLQNNLYIGGEDKTLYTYSF